MRNRFRFGLAAFSLTSVWAGAPGEAGAQAPLPLVPANIAPKLADSLALVRADLDKRLTTYRKHKADYDKSCPENQQVDAATLQACNIKHAAIMPEATALGEEKGKFVSFIAKLNSQAPEPYTNTAVVDARGAPEGSDLIAQVPELAKSPEASRIIKGYQGVMHHDWPMALLWWKDALKGDPNNEALKRSVDLAQWMVDRKNRVEPDLKDAVAEPIPPLSAAIYAAARGDNVSAIRHFEEAKKQNPSSAAGLDDMIDILQRKEDDRNVWSKAEIQAYDARINSEADMYTRKALKAQAAGDYKSAETYYFIADITRMHLSTDSPPPGAPRVQRKE